MELAVEVEQTVLGVLAELKPENPLYTNVEFYAGVVMDRCGLPRELFTPTFAVSRVIGWCANIAEQAAERQIIRPAARYVGPPPPEPVPLRPRPKACRGALPRADLASGRGEPTATEAGPGPPRTRWCPAPTLSKTLRRPRLRERTDRRVQASRSRTTDGSIRSWSCPRC